ncbi:MAG: hypoxanthine phosphoribosyltransferase [Candidatus Eisenbacteria bacterium]|uniref:Hypoxanthine phosphoribosyltransferase n=1 Tax=Eiseniibacteriota bacterium TaxID=2212470 RepID=A0A956LZ35_UNCEI|nr:hypoxanthine phosphoribosyltransferase [Candidatus Eisenbacteria bacterium]
MYSRFQTGDRLRVGSSDLRVLLGEQQIRDRVREIGASVRARLEGDVPVFIGMLSGGVVFLSDLIRVYDGDHEIDFLKVSRYDRRQLDPTAVRVLHDLRSNVRGRSVVLVEGIRARGTKIQYVDRFLRLHQPKRIVYCAMIEPAEAQKSVPLDESGFRIDNEFVVGYGLDYEERYRNLPFIGVLEPNALAKTPGTRESA